MLIDKQFQKEVCDLQINWLITMHPTSVEVHFVPPQPGCQFFFQSLLNTGKKTRPTLSRRTSSMTVIDPGAYGTVSKRPNLEGRRTVSVSCRYSTNKF